MKRLNAFHIEPATHPESGSPIWLLVDDRDGTWAEFSNRAAALACLRGYAAIGFVPRPEEPSTVPRAYTCSPTRRIRSLG